MSSNTELQTIVDDVSNVFSSKIKDSSIDQNTMREIAYYIKTKYAIDVKGFSGKDGTFCIDLG